MAIFQFGGYTLQTARPSNSNLQTAREWTEADPDHRDTTTAGFWFEHSSGIESYILEDHKGIVFFFKMKRWSHSEVELHIQFPPAELNPRMELARRDRVASALTLGFEWIEKVLAVQEVSTLFFVSQSPNLMRFCEKRLGFVRKGFRLEKTIEPLKGKASFATNGN